MEVVPLGLRQFSVRHLFAVLAVIAAAFSFVSALNSLVLGIHTFLFFSGWFLWWHIRGRLAVIIPMIFGIDLLLCSSFDWVIEGREDFLFARFATQLLAFLIVFFGWIVVGWTIVTKKSFWVNQLGIAITLSLAMTLLSTTASFFGDRAIQKRRATDNAKNASAMAAAIQWVESIREDLGRTPTETELENLISYPFPSVQWDGLCQTIEYQRIDDQGYQLIFFDPGNCFFSDVIVYDSLKPEKGWKRKRF